MAHLVHLSPRELQIIEGFEQKTPDVTAGLRSFFQQSGSIDAIREAISRAISGASPLDLNNEILPRRIQSFLEELALHPISLALPSRLRPKATLSNDLRDLTNNTAGSMVKEVVDLIWSSCENHPPQVVWALAFQLASGLPPSQKKRIPPEIEDIISLLNSHWKDKFCGGSLAALKERILKHEMETCDQGFKYYAKLIPIIQSSGMGKSRLIDEIGKSHLCITVTLRENGESGYPPGDPEITKFLKEPLHAPEDVLLAHSYMLALLDSIFGFLMDWIEGHAGNSDEQTLAKQWYDLMAPKPILQYPSDHRDLSTVIAATRSVARKDFCEKVVEGAHKTLRELQKDDQWTMFFKNYHEIDFHQFKTLQIVQRFIGLVEVFFQRLSRYIGDRALVLVAFDEVHHMYTRCGTGELFPALRHLLHELQKYHLWAFSLSTESSMETLLPPQAQDSSQRVATGLKRFDPFIGFQLDLGMALKLTDDPETELRKPLSQLATKEHMTLFGRPLWSVYKEYDVPTFRNIVLAKLLHDRSGFYDPHNLNHVFAALAARILLDPCTQLVNSSARDLAGRAVTYHLRLVTHMDGEHRTFTTMTPSEPVVSDAVAWTLCSAPQSGTTHNAGGNMSTNWEPSIRTLAQYLLHPGIIEKGLKGELYVRLLLILARDFLLKSTEHPSPTQPSSFPYSHPFKVLAFLHSAFSSDIYEQIISMVPHQRTREVAGQQQLSHAFANAWCNFTHFVNTDRNIKRSAPGEFKELIHGCILQHAALQCAFGQPIWDLIIPVYIGNTSGSLRQENISAILIQVKNRTKVTRLSLKNHRSDYQQYFGGSWCQPLLIILVDVGTKTPYVQFADSFNDMVYGVSIGGTGTGVYRLGNAPLGIHQACNQLLAELVCPNGTDLHGEICDQNVRFRYHTFRERFPASWDSPKLDQDVMEAEGDEVADEVGNSGMEDDEVGSGVEDSEMEL